MRRTETPLTAKQILSRIIEEFEGFPIQHPDRTPTAIRVGRAYYETLQEFAHSAGRSVIPDFRGYPIRLNRSNPHGIQVVGKLKRRKIWSDSLEEQPREGFAK